jgi:hypothetical protein
MTGTEATTTAFERHSYEDPWLDMASTRLPKSIRKLQELCQIFALTHPQIAPIIWRLAEYPITSLVYEGDEEACRQYKEILEEKMGLLDFLIECGLDYYAYGNAFPTISFPFIRYYRCDTCQGQWPAKQIKYRYDGSRFMANCPGCRGSERSFEPQDKYLPRSNGIRAFRLEPMMVTPKYNRVTGQYFYFYDVPLDLKQAILRGDRDIIDSTPVNYIRAVRSNVKLRVNRIFHFKRPTLSGRDMGWGLPLIMPALKDAYLNQIYKKADEQIALEHSVPLRIMYPEPGTQDPLSRIALGSFRQFMEANIRYWRKDKNAILTAPLPVGVKVVGGDSSAYTTIQSRQFVVEEIMGAMMVTKGFVMGGENWSAASISQRMLENSFLNYIRRIDACLQWIVGEVRDYLKLPPCKVHLQDFKKIDDVQMLQVVVQLARENRVSWNEALSRMGLDSRQQLKQIEQEAAGYLRVMMDQLVSQAEAGAKSAQLQAQAQVEAEGVAQTLQGQLGGGQQPAGALPPGQGDPNAQQPGATVTPAGAGGDNNVRVPIKMQAQIDNWAQEIVNADPATRRQLLGRMAKDSPQLGKAVAQRASEIEATGGADAILDKGNGDPKMVAQHVAALPGKQQLKALKAIQSRNPPLGIRVMQELARVNSAQAANPAGHAQPTTVDMRPQPEQLPPRRAGRAI